MNRTAKDLLPQDTDAEKAVIGSLLIDPSCVPAVAKLAKPADFIDPLYAAAFRVMVDLDRSGGLVEPVIVLRKLRDLPELRHQNIGGALGEVGYFVDQITHSTVTSAHAEHYAGLVAEASRKRRLAIMGDHLSYEARNGSSAGDVMADFGSQWLDLTRDSPAAVACLADVESTKPSWLWQYRIPRASITDISGDPATGKSTLLTDLIARITVGAPLPPAHGDDFTYPPESVVWCSAEDSPAMTLRPRLDAAGGDATRVYLPRVRELPADIDLLRECVMDNGAALIVIDPPEAFLSSDVDAHANASVRRALTPIAELAEASGAAVVFIRHLNKQTGQRAAYRASGSIAWTAAARSAFIVASDPEDENIRLLVATKCNLCLKPPALAYRIENHRGIGRVVWIDERPDVSADRVLGNRRQADPEGRVAKACGRIIDELETGGTLTNHELRQKKGLKNYQLFKTALDSLLQDGTIEKCQGGLRLAKVVRTYL